MSCGPTQNIFHKHTQTQILVVTKDQFMSNQKEHKLSIIHFNDAYHIGEGHHEPVGGASRFRSLVKSLDHLKPLVLFGGDMFNPSLCKCKQRIDANWNSELNYQRNAYVRCVEPIIRFVVIRSFLTFSSKCCCWKSCWFFLFCSNECRILILELITWPCCWGTCFVDSSPLNSKPNTNQVDSFESHTTKSKLTKRSTIM